MSSESNASEVDQDEGEDEMETDESSDDVEDSQSLDSAPNANNTDDAHLDDAQHDENALVLQRIERPWPGSSRVGTVRVVKLPTLSGEDESEQQQLQQQLWVCRHLGEWTAQEHQQLRLGLLTYGQGSWRQIQRAMVPSRSEAELRVYARRYLSDVVKPPPMPPMPSHLQPCLVVPMLASSVD